jgi:hypothetical protein
MKKPPAFKNYNKGIHSIHDLQVSLAEYLLRLEPGDRLPSVAELASSTHMSVGSVSTALNELEASGVVKIQKRGHLGSIVESVEIGKIWNLIEQSPFVIALSLPMHSHFEGLATALKASVEKLGIETYLIFIRGSNTRLRALKDNRCHVSVLSGLAADESISKGYEILLQLPPGTWLSGYNVFYRDPYPAPGELIRVAVDFDSHDHRRLSELEFTENKVEFKHAPFVQFPRLLKRGEVDALLWTKDQEDAYLSAGIASRPLSKKVMELIGDRSISATIIGRSDRPVVKTVITTAVKAETVIEIQSKIVSGEMIPEY